MVAAGLVEEVASLRAVGMSAGGAEEDGIHQTIGFKEFRHYLEHLSQVVADEAKKELSSNSTPESCIGDSGSVTSSQLRARLIRGDYEGIGAASDLQSLRVDGIEKVNIFYLIAVKLNLQCLLIYFGFVIQTKAATRQYAKRQQTWIRNRLIPLLKKRFFIISTTTR